MSAWVLMISLWSGDFREFHYCGSYKSHKQCDAMAERISGLRDYHNGGLKWICVEVPE